MARGGHRLAQAARLIVAAAAIPLAAFAMHDAMAAFWRQHVGSTVPPFLAGNAAIGVARAERHVDDRGWFTANAGTIRRNARRALRHSPLDAVAMRQLAMLADLERPEAALPLVRIAERISRRDLLTQLYLIDVEARAGNIGQVLRHYDRALLVRPQTRTALFKPLASALELPEARVAMRPFASRKWFRDFVSGAGTHGASPAATIALLEDVRGHMPRAAYEDLATLLLGKLVAEGHLAEASQLASQVQGNRHNALGTFAFSEETVDRRLGPFAWVLQNDEATEAELHGTDELRIAIQPARSSLAAERVTVFPPGEYELLQELTYDAATPRATLSWEVRCGGNETPLWKQRLPAAPGRVIYRALIAIPDNCSGQTWRIFASADETQFPSIAQVGGLRLIEPVAGEPRP